MIKDRGIGYVTLLRTSTIGFFWEDVVQILTAFFCKAGNY